MKLSVFVLMFVVGAVAQAQKNPHVIDEIPQCSVAAKQMAAAAQNLEPSKFEVRSTETTATPNEYSVTVSQADGEGQMVVLVADTVGSGFLPRSFSSTTPVPVAKNSPSCRKTLENVAAQTEGLAEGSEIAWGFKVITTEKTSQPNEYIVKSVYDNDEFTATINKIGDGCTVSVLTSK